MHRNTDIGAWNCCWLTLRRWCTWTFESVSLIDMPIVCQGENVGYMRRMTTLVSQVEEVMALHRGYELSFGCLSSPYDRFHLTRDAADC